MIEQGFVEIDPGGLAAEMRAATAVEVEGDGHVLRNEDKALFLRLHARGRERAHGDTGGGKEEDEES